MPTSYTTTVTVEGYTTGVTYGSQLDSLEIISGSTSPYELPQPPSARASFLGLPTVYTLTQTPDWWIGKKVTFTITPQGATGSVSWTGIVQGYTCSPVQTSSADQIVELDLLGQTSRLSTEMISSDIIAIGGIPYWTSIYTSLNGALNSLTWEEAPVGLTWADVNTTWATYDNNKSGLTFTNGSFHTNPYCVYNMGGAGQDMLSFITERFSNKWHGWFWFDNSTITIQAPTDYTNYAQLTSLDATSCVLWSSLNSNQNMSNVMNSAVCANSDSSASYSYLDGTSFNTYGDRSIDFGNSYEGTGQLIRDMITDKVNAYKQPNKYLQSLTIDLDQLTHVTGEWQNFYKSTKPVRLPITNIPAAYGGNHTYMVRGVQLNLTNKHAEATLLVVPSTIYNPS